MNSADDGDLTFGGGCDCMAKIIAHKTLENEFSLDYNESDLKPYNVPRYPIYMDQVMCSFWGIISPSELGLKIPLELGLRVS